MHWPLRLGSSGFVLLLGTVLAAACSSSKTNNGFAEVDSGNVEDAGIVDTGVIIDKPCSKETAPATCSSDATKVVKGTCVVETCSEGKACSGGACLPSCDQAAKSKSSVGCEYFAISPPGEAGESAFGPKRFPSSCFVAFIANSWDVDVKLLVDYDGQSLNPDTFAVYTDGAGVNLKYRPITGGIIPPGKVAMVFLSNQGSTACPAGVTAPTTKTSFYGNGRGKAFRLRTSAPVVAYDIFPYGGGSSAMTSATLLIPTSAWGTNYMGLTAYKSNQGNPSMAIAAQSDNTKVTIVPTANIQAGNGIDAVAANTPVTYTLNAGEYLKIEQKDDVLGSPVQADKPIAMVAGNDCAYVPANFGACDGLQQQVPPIQSFGSRYAIMHYRDRYPPLKEAPPYRVVGAVAGTTLKFTPPIAGAPTTIGVGEMAEFNAQDGFVVESQDANHPFYLASYMTGCGFAMPKDDPDAGVDDSGDAKAPVYYDCRGDPDYVNVVPDSQYLASYTFVTDPTYPETNLVFVRKKAQDGTFHDVTLDCAGVLKDWQAIPGTDFQWVRADLSRGNFQKQGTCDNGIHKALSDTPFGLTIWGWGSGESIGFFSQAVSYGYPAGASIVPINTVVVPAVPK